MKKLLNTLYITSNQTYLGLDGEDVVINNDNLPNQKIKIPLHTIESIITFSYVGASPQLMGKCAELNKSIVFLLPNGKFLARVIGKQYGNILLRKAQFYVTENEEQSIIVAKNIIKAKLGNSINVIRRGISDHSDKLDVKELQIVVDSLRNSIERINSCVDRASIRGVEGEAASKYFGVFDSLIINQKEDFKMLSRNKRPPLDMVNAMLSFAYSLLTSMCVSALESVGLDPYAGVLHTDRPGRCSLALDLMEEFRAYFCDRFVLSLINKRMVCSNDFIIKENKAVVFKEEAKKDFLSSWQNRKKEIITHPFLNEKIEMGMLPYVQALLLARYIRKDMDGYPPFVWK